MVAMLGPFEALPYYIHIHTSIVNRSGMVAVLGPFEALPYYIYTYIHLLYSLIVKLIECCRNSLANVFVSAPTRP
jgi:hypothetical protein